MVVGWLGWYASSNSHELFSSIRSHHHVPLFQISSKKDKKYQSYSIFLSHTKCLESVLNSVLNRVISPCGEFGQYGGESFCFFLFQCSKIVNGGTKGAKNYGKSQTKESDMKVTHGTNWDKHLK